MKVVVVEGPKSSGKTSSIKAAIAALGLDYSANGIADIRAISDLKIGRKNWRFGIASAGDSAGIIRANAQFFCGHDLDFAIFACSAPRSGRKIIEAFAVLQGGELISVQTERVVATARRAIEARVAETAEKIVASLR